MKLIERLAKLRRTLAEYGGNVPTIYDQEAGVSFVRAAAGEKFIRMFAAEHGRELTYPFDVTEVGEDGPIPSGLYMQTNFTPEELYPNTPLVAAHGEICTNILLVRERMRLVDALYFNPSRFVTKEGFTLAELVIVDPRQLLGKGNIDP